MGGTAGSVIVEQCPDCEEGGGGESRQEGMGAVYRSSDRGSDRKRRGRDPGRGQGRRRPRRGARQRHGSGVSPLGKTGLAQSTHCPEKIYPQQMYGATRRDHVLPPLSFGSDQNQKPVHGKSLF